MKINYYCIPCFIKQVLDTAKIANIDMEAKNAILEEICPKLPGYAFLEMTPPEIAKEVYTTIANISGIKDPYKQIKKDYKPEEDGLVIQQPPYLMPMKIVSSRVNAKTVAKIEYDLLS